MILHSGGFGNFGQQQQQPQQQQTTGTRTVPWQKTPETEGTGSQRTTVNYVTISCMQPYQSKSPEELRWEDYQVRVPLPASHMLQVCSSCRAQDETLSAILQGSHKTAWSAAHSKAKDECSAWSSSEPDCSPASIRHLMRRAVMLPHVFGSALCTSAHVSLLHWLWFGHLFASMVPLHDNVHRGPAVNCLVLWLSLLDRSQSLMYPCCIRSAIQLDVSQAMQSSSCYLATVNKVLA